MSVVLSAFCLPQCSVEGVGQGMLSAACVASLVPFSSLVAMVASVAMLGTCCGALRYRCLLSASRAFFLFPTITCLAVAAAMASEEVCVLSPLLSGLFS